MNTAKLTIYRIIRPFATGIWVWKKYLLGNEPAWLFFAVLNGWSVAFTVCADDDVVVQTLIEEILHY